MSNNNVSIFSDYYQHDVSNNISHQQPMTNAAPNNNVTMTSNNYQQYDASNNIPKDNSPDYNHHVLNNIPYQQSISDITDSTSISQYSQNPPHSSIHIDNINNVFIIIPSINSDIQNQLQQIFACLNHSSSTDNSQTRSQQ